MIALMYFFCPSWGPQTAEQRSNILRALAGYTPDYSEATTLNRKLWWMSAHNFPASKHSGGMASQGQDASCISMHKGCTNNRSKSHFEMTSRYRYPIILDLTALPSCPSTRQNPPSPRIITYWSEGFNITVSACIICQ
jgi:hypothetical protein